MCNLCEGNYFYVINFQDNEESLCALEMKCLFQTSIERKYFTSKLDLLPSRSVFIKYRILIIRVTDAIEDIEHFVASNRQLLKNFKFLYVNVDENEIEYCAWKTIVARLCIAADAAENHESPKQHLAVLHIENKWILGSCIKNDNEWKYHEYKPNTNSHSLGIRIARTIVNIAVENRLDLSVVDPCCGVGTVVIEAASMGLNIKGYEISKKVAAAAKENLLFFGVENAIFCNDMHRIKDHFDVSIIDIPYGLFTSVHVNDQIEIIKTARRISDKSVIITIEDMGTIISDAGFSIIDRCCASKGRFRRYVNVCT